MNIKTRSEMLSLLSDACIECESCMGDASVKCYGENVNCPIELAIRQLNAMEVKA
jgi:hypothetical protein